MNELAAPPLQTSLVQPPSDPRAPDAVWGITRAWNQWLLSLTTRLEGTARNVNSVSVADQEATITATTINLGDVDAGLYRVSWYARITRAATTSSSLTVTIGWVDDSVSQTQSGAAMTGNTTTTNQSGSALIRVDRNSAITYETAYASVGATTMQYRLDVVVEQVL